MKKIAIVCSGQGSQYVGQTEQLKKLDFYNQANEVLSFDLLQICKEGSSDKINQTAITQPALLTHSWSQYKEVIEPLKDKVQIEIVLGHSVGEYAALVIAGSLSFEHALKAVHLRGQSMQEATPLGVGSMFAILKLDSAPIQKACEQASDDQFKVSIANHNSPGQIVISGHKEACAKAIEILKEDQGSIRAIELKVSAPFHSSLMKPAQEKMREFFSITPIQSNSIAYTPNISAETLSKGSSPEVIKENLLEQIPGQVRWTQSIQNLPESIDAIVELGPGKTLKGLIKRINPQIQTYSMDLSTDREAFYEYLS